MCAKELPLQQPSSSSPSAGAEFQFMLKNAFLSCATLRAALRQPQWQQLHHREVVLTEAGGHR